MKLPVVIGLDDNLANTLTMAQAFGRAGFAFRAAPSLRAILAQAGEAECVVVLRAEPRSEAAHHLLGALGESPQTASTRVMLLCEDTSLRTWCEPFQTGLVGLFPLPFQSTYPSQLVALLQRLSERTGVLTGVGPASAVAMLRNFARTGELLVDAPEGDGRVRLRVGQVEEARLGDVTGPRVLERLQALPKARWRFGPLSVVEEEELPELEVISEEVAVTGTSGPPVPLLFVDDDPELCRMFSILFGRNGFDVTVAQDGEEGFLRAAERPYALVIADLNMPKLDGWGMLRRVRDDFRTRELLFAMLSNQDSYRDSLQALDAGANAYFAKTTTPLMSLVDKVRGLLQPRVDFGRRLTRPGPHTFALSQLGPQWVLSRLAEAGASGTLQAEDQWARYELALKDGQLHAAHAWSSAKQVSEARALDLYVSARAPEAAFIPGAPQGEGSFQGPIAELLATAVASLNESAQRVKDVLLVQPGEIVIHKELYEVYSHNGPPRWLPTAKLLCEQRLTPKEILSQVDENPLEIEEALRDLLRRGVVTIRRARH
jgi:CheY-like chemotaxis protein